MFKKIFLFNVIFIYLFCTEIALSKQSNFFKKGIDLYEKNQFEKSKIFFEKDIVFNPKSEKSYLYLAKIFSKDENDQEQERNLYNVLLLNPQNDEAIYMLTLLKIKQSDYEEAKTLIERFDLVCKSFCSKKAEMQEKFEKLKPENAKEKN